MIVGLTEEVQKEIVKVQKQYGFFTQTETVRFLVMQGLRASLTSTDRGAK